MGWLIGGCIYVGVALLMWGYHKWSVRNRVEYKGAASFQDGVAGCACIFWFITLPTGLWIYFTGRLKKYMGPKERSDEKDNSVHDRGVGSSSD